MRYSISLRRGWWNMKEMLTLRYYVWAYYNNSWNQTGSHDGYNTLEDAVYEAQHHINNGVEYKILTAR